MERSRAPGQRPFPRGAPPLRLSGRWRCHDYPVEVTESACNRLLTVDAKRNLKIWRAGDMRCIFRCQLGDFSCHVPWLEPQERAGPRPDEGELALAGLAVGNAGGIIQLFIMDLKHPEVPQALQSNTSHTASVVQVDFTWLSNVFVSVGEDQSVKIWSVGLVLLKEIGFPQPLTTVMFRRRIDMDQANGHDDLLLGFAAHVEKISFEFWSRGLPERCAVGDTKKETASIPQGTGRGLLRLDASDDINDHTIYLHAKKGQTTVRDFLGSRKGVGIQGACFVATFTKRLLRRVRTRRPESQGNDMARQRWGSGEVLDFRGPPVCEVGALSGQVVDWTVLNVKDQPSAEPSVAHQRIEMLDIGAFRDIMRCPLGYYDFQVSRTEILDAPRMQAIRGTAHENNVAVVTSLGIGHLRPHAKREDPEPLDSLDLAVSEASGSVQARVDAPNRMKPQPTSQGPCRPCKLPQSPQTSLHDKGRVATPQPSQLLKRRDSDATASSCSKADSARLSSATDTGHVTVKRGEEKWRSQHVARGVPKAERTPRTQGLANSADDTAHMLAERRNILEVPNELETNFLKKLFTQKTEWLYSHPDSDVIAQRSRAVEESRRRSTRHVPAWTPHGRLVCSEQLPPARAVPALPPFLSPDFKQQICLTRAEVTERRLILTAQCGPPPQPDLAVHATPASARASSVAGGRSAAAGRRPEVREQRPRTLLTAR